MKAALKNIAYCLALTTTAPVASADQIPQGIGDIILGMTEKQYANTGSGVRRKPDTEHPESVIFDSKTRINEEVWFVSSTFINQHLSILIVSNSDNNPETFKSSSRPPSSMLDRSGCDSYTYELAQMLAKRYRRFDHPPSVNEKGGDIFSITTSQSIMSFTDRTLTLTETTTRSSIITDTSCEISIKYGLIESDSNSGFR